MLVLRLELHDANKGGAVSELGRLVIANMGPDEAVYGDYVVALGEAGRDPRTIFVEPQKQGFVHDHPRKESAWSLVAKALRSVGFGRLEARRLREQREGET